MTKKTDEVEVYCDDIELDVVNQIIELAATIGWGIAIRDDEDEEVIDHFIIGVLPALEEIDKALECYTIMAPASEKEETRH